MTMTVWQESWLSGHPVLLSQSKYWSTRVWVSSYDELIFDQRNAILKHLSVLVYALCTMCIGLTYPLFSHLTF